MPTYEVDVSGTTYEVDAPDDATAWQWANQYHSQQFPSPEKDIGDRLSNMAEGVGLAVKAPFIGAGNLVGIVPDERISEFKQEVQENVGKPGGFGGQAVGGALPAAGLSLLPGGNTMSGAALYNGLYGFIQPAESATERAINTGVGAAGGFGGQLAGQGLKAVTKRFLTAAEQKAAAEASRESLRNEAVKAGFDAGYALPRSEYNPSFLSNRLESIGGKAAIKQDVIGRNQEVSNRLAKQSLGIDDSQPLSIKNIETVREKAYEPYREIANLPKVADVPDRPANWTMMDPGAKGKKGFDPAKALEDLKQARNDSQGWFDAYNRSASPKDLATAKEYRSKAESLEKKIEEYAKSIGRDDLVPQLRESRKTIAKTYTVERAVNKSTGDIDARVIGRLYDKQKPLSGGLEKVGQFAAGFPKYTGYGPTNPTAGVSKAEALAGSMLGVGTAAATGSPSGLLAAGIPLLSHPARAAALSQMMQSLPQYGPGFLPLLPGRVARTLPAAGASVGLGLLNQQ